MFTVPLGALIVCRDRDGRVEGMTVFEFEKIMKSPRTIATELAKDVLNANF